MSFQIPKTFYGAGYAVCAILFFVSFMSTVEEEFRVAGIALASILFIVLQQSMLGIGTNTIKTSLREFDS